MEFKPTWLYIKQHNATGLKYFGKTIRNPYTYNGSGTYWSKHLAKHGTNIETVWCQLFESKDELTHFAREFSIKNNIVESNDWANLKPEDGLMGGSFGEVSEATRQKISAKSKKHRHTEETKAKIKEARAKQKPARLGAVLSDETKEKIRQKRALQVVRKGWKHSAETKNKISISKLQEKEKRNH